MDYTVYQLLWLFLFYSFLGWLAETVLAALKRRRLLNRGFLSAPFSPTYGLGALLFAIFLPELREDPFFLFLLGMILATFLEFVTGVFLERIFHQKWWDYSGQRFQFEGHICLKYSVIWGLSALLAIFVLNPIFLTLVGLIPRTAGEIVLLVVYILLGVDFVGSWAAVLQLHGALSEPTHISRFLSRLTHTLDTTVTRHIQRRMERAYPSLERERLSGKQAPKVKPERFAQGCGFYKLAALFFIGSFLGDITETIWCWAVLGKLMSRSSVLYGPFSIVWGLGCVLLTALLYKYKDRSDRYIFLAGTVLGGAYEYSCSVFTELVFGTVFWDYSAIPFNLGGRINLLYCFFWGFAAVVWFRVVYPRISAWIEKIPMVGGKAGTWVLIVFMVCNIIISALALDRYTQRSAGDAPQTTLGLFLDRHYPDQRIERVYPNAKIVD